MGSVTELRRRVYRANMEIPRQKLAKLTWGKCERM